MSSQVEQSLLQEKIDRDDTGSYIGNLLIRQRLINEAVVKFADPLIPENARVIDACAGPEGSWLASARRGYSWIGNDVSQKFAQILSRTGANVVLSDFSSAPFKDNTADAIFFIFALNNICNPDQTFAEAARITKTKGIVVDTEPGLSIWVTNILLHAAASRYPEEGFSDYIKERPFSEEVLRHFAGKPYTEEEYTDLILRNTVNMGISDLLSIIRENYDSKSGKRRISFKFHEAFTRLYFDHILTSSQQAGFRLVKSGLLAIAQTSSEWSVSPVVKVASDNWLNQLMQTRLWKREKDSIIDQFPAEMDHVAKRMVFPILCMEKQ